MKSFLLVFFKGTIEALVEGVIVKAVAKLADELAQSKAKQAEKDALLNGANLLVARLREELKNHL